MSAGNERVIKERNALAWVAWHTANLTRAKRMPKLDALMVKMSTPKARRQTWQEQMAVMDQWIAVMDAIETNKEKARS